MHDSLIKKIITTPVYDIALETNLERMRILSEKYGNEIFIKREDEQSVFSFKLRGAYQKIKGLGKEARERGVIAASAGNHAQGVALAASKLSCPATIVMPKPTASIKVDNCKRLGAKVILYGDNFDEACKYALALAKEQNLSFIHPYDDEDVMAGQGTIAMELLRSLTGPVKAVFIPVGGGGLCAGMAAFIKFFRPEIKVITVEAEGSACFKAAKEADSRVVLPRVDLFAEGVAVKQIGEKTFEVLKKTVDESLTVSNDEIAAAVKDIFVDTRAIAEPSGAVGLAGLKKYIRNNNLKGETLATVLTGANVNFERLRVLSQMSEMSEGEILFTARLPERPGSFLSFCIAIDGADVSEFNYRFSNPSQAHVFVGIVLKPGQHREELYSKLDQLGYDVVDMTENNLAKTHVRYMIGGHPSSPKDEVLFSFEFPERPGALRKFLESFASRWNLTLFHYRNQGTSIGRVFVGLDIPKAERAEAKECFEKLGYPYTIEGDNIAYDFFLK